MAAEKMNEPIGEWERNVLTVSQMDSTNYFSNHLWKPFGNKGAFGGQLFSQGIHAMMLTVGTGFSLASVHSHYLLSALIEKGILYKVERIRDGTTYCTRTVSAIQDNKVVFVAFATFKRPEKHSFSYQACTPHMSYPQLIPRAEYQWQDMCKADGTGKLPKPFIWYSVGKVEREPKIIETRISDIEQSGVLHDGAAKSPCKQLWIRHPRSLEALKPSEEYLHCLILAFASDQYFLATAISALGMNVLSPKMGQYATLDHTMWIHEYPIKMDEWHLYDIETLKIHDNRALVLGKIYSQRTKKHVATVIQEGVIRMQNTTSPVTNNVKHNL